MERDNRMNHRCMAKRGFLFIAGVFCITLMAGLLPAMAEIPKDAATIPVLEVKFDDTFFCQGESVVPKFRNPKLPFSIFEGAPNGATLMVTNAGTSQWSACVGLLQRFDFRFYGKEVIEIEYRGDAILSDLTFKLCFKGGETTPFPLTNNAICDGEWKKIRVPIGDAAKDHKLYSLICSVKKPAEPNGTLNIRAFRVWREQINTRIDADAILAVPPAMNVAVSNVNGAVLITIDGQPITGGGYTKFQIGNSWEEANTPAFKTMYAPVFADSSLRCHRVEVSIGFDHSGWRAESWLGPDHFDFSAFDAMMKMVNDLNPESKVILHCSIDFAPWWNLLHPDCWDPWYIPRANKPPPESRTIVAYMPDYGSDEWRRDSRDAVRQFIAHVQSGPFADKVIGYQLMAGAGNDNQFNLIPRTPRQLQRFRDSLRTKYGNHTAALTNAWRDPSVTFETALPLQLNGSPVSPDRMAYASPYAYQLPNPPSLILVPAENARLADTMEFIRRAEETLVLDFCQTVKEATHNRRLAGTQHGNLLAGQHKREPAFHWSWKKPLEAFMKSPYVDFFEQWPNYQGRGVGNVCGFDVYGDVPVCPPLGTAKNNKFIALENDYRNEPTGQSETDRDILSYYRRIFFTSLVWGMSPYLWDMSYLHKMVQVLPEWHLQEDILERAFKLDRSTGAEVAFVFDPDYTRFTGYDTTNSVRKDTAGVELINKATSDWCRSGVPFDMIFLDQLTNTAPYKVYVFFLTLGLSDEQRTQIQNVTRRNGIVSIFLWADGYINDGTGAASAANISALTGMNITKIAGPQKWVMTPEPWFTNAMGLASDHKLGVLPRRGNPVHLARGLNATFDPSFAVITNAATKAIAKYDNGPGAGLVGMAIQSNTNYTVIYSGSQMIGSPIIRYACQQAKVFSYTEDREQLLYIGNSFIGIHAAMTNDMTLTLNLPAATPLYNIYNDIELPAATRFSVPLTFKDNVLFFRGTRAAWQNLAGTNESVLKQMPAEEYVTPPLDKAYLGRYVRIERNLKALWFCEVQVMSGGVNVALHKPASQSSIQSTNTVASIAVDGDVNPPPKGRYIATGGGEQEWWEVDLKEALPIDEIILWNGNPSILIGETVKILDADRKTLWTGKINLPAAKYRIIHYDRILDISFDHPSVEFQVKSSDQIRINVTTVPTSWLQSASLKMISGPAPVEFDLINPQVWKTQFSVPGTYLVEIKSIEVMFNVAGEKVVRPAGKVSTSIVKIQVSK